MTEVAPNNILHHLNQFLRCFIGHNLRIRPKLLFNTENGKLSGNPQQRSVSLGSHLSTSESGVAGHRFWPTFYLGKINIPIIS